MVEVLLRYTLNEQLHPRFLNKERSVCLENQEPLVENKNRQERLWVGHPHPKKANTRGCIARAEAMLLEACVKSAHATVVGKC